MTALVSIKAAWSALAVRERRMLGLAAAVVGAALVWWLLLAGPLATLNTATAQRQKIDAQLQHMQALARQAASLQSQTRTTPQDAARLLQSTAQQMLGTNAQIAVMGDRATLSLKGANADALAQWLAQARQNAQALPVEVRISRSNSPGTSGVPTWDGSVVLNLPTR